MKGIHPELLQRDVENDQRGPKQAVIAPYNVTQGAELAEMKI